MKKVVIISPVHVSNDIRVFKKEAQSLLDYGFYVRAIVKSYADDSPIKKDDCICLNYNTRLKRFLLIPFIIYLALKEKADYYHLHNPDTIIVGFFLFLFGKKVIYDTHENFSKKIMIRKWLPKYIRSFVATAIHSSEIICSKLFYHFIVTQESQIIDFKDASVIGNAPIYKKYKITNKSIPSEVQPIKLVFIGGMSIERGLINMHQLFLSIKKKKHVTLTLIGPFLDDEAKLYFEENMIDIKDIILIPLLPQVEAFEIVEKSHFGLILFDDVADYSDICPNKIFEYMMLKTPFIASAFPNWKKYFNKEVGLFIDENSNIDNVANELIELLDNKIKYSLMCEYCYQFIKEEYNWDLVERPRLEKIYKEL